VTSASEPDFPEPHLLVVDDDARLRELLCRYLSDSGFRVTAAADASEARSNLASFAFDLVECGVDIANGTMTTKDFKMRGPSAKVQMDGQVDLVNETQDLHVRVEPSVGNSISSILAVIVNPIWGLGAFILDKILKNPLGQALTFEYRVTGTWDKPIPERLKAEVRGTDPARQPSLP